MAAHTSADDSRIECQPDDSRWRYQLDEAGEPIRIDAPEQQSWSIARDARGNPITVTAPDGGITTYAYGNPRLPDRPTRITDPQGGVRALEWTALGQLAAHTDCSGQRSEYRYDSEGRLTAARNALGQTNGRQYDRLVRRRPGFRPSAPPLRCGRATTPTSAGPTMVLVYEWTNHVQLPIRDVRLRSGVNLNRTWVTNHDPQQPSRTERHPRLARTKRSPICAMTDAAGLYGAAESSCP